MKLIFKKIANEKYQSDNGCTMQREFDSKTPNGNKMNGRWVIRDNNGCLIGFDFNRNDLSERFGFSIINTCN